MYAIFMFDQTTHLCIVLFWYKAIVDDYQVFLWAYIATHGFAAVHVKKKDLT